MLQKPLWRGFLLGALYGLALLFLEDLFNLLLRPFDFTLRQLLFSILSYGLFFAFVGAVGDGLVSLLRAPFLRNPPASISVLLFVLVGGAVFLSGYKDLPLGFIGLGLRAHILIAMIWFICVIGLGGIVFLLLRRGRGRDPGVLLARCLAAVTTATFFIVLTLKIDYNTYWSARLEPLGGIWRLLGVGLAAGLFATSLRIYQKLLAISPPRHPLKRWDSLFMLGSALVMAFGISFILLLGHRESDAVFPGKTRRATSPPNVILIILDAVRADHLSLYGYHRPTSPNLEKYSKRGVVFTNALAPSSWTKQSIPAILTGQYPGRLGVEDFLDLLPEEVVPIPEILQPEGYSTVGFSANTLITSYFHFDQGFDRLFYVPRLGAKQLLFSGILLTYAVKGLPELILSMDLVDQNLASADAATVNREVFRWLDQNAESQFFLYLHYLDPHQPYTPTQKNFSRGKHLSAADVVTLRGLHNPLDTMAVEPRIMDVLASRYDDEIAFVDRQLGELFQRFDQLGIWDHSLVIVTADHGEEFAEHGFAGHGHSLFQESIHVPLIVFLPDKFPRGSVIPDDVDLLDIVPTICSVVGISPAGHFDGVSLLPLIEGHPEEYHLAKRPYFGEHYSNVKDWPISRSFAVFRAPYKLIHNISRMPNRPDWLGLFQLTDDPGEKVNLIEKRPEIAKELLHWLQVFRQSCDSLSIPRQTYDETQRLDFLVEQLRAIGYVH